MDPLDQWRFDGDAELAQCHFADAVRCYDKAMSRSIEEVGCSTRRIAALIGCGRRRDIRRALEAAERLATNNPTWCIAALLLATAQAKAGLPSQAVATLEKARSLLGVGRQLGIRGYTDAVRVVTDAVEAASVSAQAAGELGGDVAGLEVEGKGLGAGSAAGEGAGAGPGHEDKEREACDEDKDEGAGDSSEDEDDEECAEGEEEEEVPRAPRNLAELAMLDAVSAAAVRVALGLSQSGGGKPVVLSRQSGPWWTEEDAARTSGATGVTSESGAPSTAPSSAAEAAAAAAAAASEGSSPAAGAMSETKTGEGKDDPESKSSSSACGGAGGDGDDAASKEADDDEDGTYKDMEYWLLTAAPHRPPDHAEVAKEAGVDLLGDGDKDGAGAGPSGGASSSGAGSGAGAGAGAGGEIVAGAAPGVEAALTSVTSAASRPGTAAAAEEARLAMADTSWRPPSTTRSHFPHIHIVKYGPHYRGVHAVRDVPPNTLLMSIDVRFLITVEMGKRTDIGRRMAQARPPLELSAAKHCYTAVFVMLDMLNGESFYQPYYRVLPAAFPSIPVFWDDEELKLLAGSYVQQQVLDRRANIDADYDEIARVAPSFTRFTREQFLWARMMVASRNFGVNIGGQKTDALVPYADMLNHYRPRETRWTYNNSMRCFTIHSIDSLKAGEQIYDSYGKKCNSRFLLNYGFTVDFNRDDECSQCHNEVKIDLQLLGAAHDPWWGQKRALLESGEHKRSVRVAAYLSHAGTKEALSFLRFAHAQRTEVARLPYLGQEQDLGRKPIRPLSCRNEADVLGHLAQVCRAQLEGYPTTLEEDVAELAAGTYPVGCNRRNCLVLLRGEKEILAFFCNLARECVPLLQLPGSELHAVLASGYYAGDSDLDRYVRQVVRPLVFAERPPEAGGVAPGSGGGEGAGGVHAGGRGLVAQGGAAAGAVAMRSVG